MKKSNAFRLFYYLNNTIFSFLLIDVIITLSFAVLIILKKQGITTADVSFTTSTFNVISDLITKMLVLVALYYSFLALNNIKQGNYNFPWWHKHFSVSAVLFSIACFTNLLNIELVNKTQPLSKTAFIYTADNFYLRLNSSSLFLLSIGIMLYFIASVKFDHKQAG